MSFVQKSKKIEGMTTHSQFPQASADSQTDFNNDFFQNGPELSNTFAHDTVLKEYINKTIPKTYLDKINQHLNKVGELAAHEWLTLSRRAENEKPVLTQFNEWGKRIDHIEVSPSWKVLEQAAAREGIVATAFERQQAEYSRVYQMALLYLYAPSSAFFACPLAMTDGAARALELHGSEVLQKRALPHLLARDPESFWTSGQWMTERTGGSDVSGTSTLARPVAAGEYTLSGMKWFTSATTSQMALTLARIEGEKSLSLFYLELEPNKPHIEVLRLKDKLGTDALPTAELILKSARAHLVGPAGEGVKRIASVLNITRIYNSICAVTHMRRCLDLAQSYAQKRVAFGRLIAEQPLHRRTLDLLEEQFRRCFKLTFYTVELLGKEEVGKATESEKKLLRALTPITKLYTAKKAMQIASEVVESFGGAGYIENTHIPRLLRDAQVYSIWEGTTNVLSLDFLRACEKDKAHEVLIDALKISPEIFQKYAAIEHARELAFAVADAVIERI